MAKQTITIRNKSARIKTLQLPGGQMVSIAPQDPGTGGGGTTITIDSETEPHALERLQQALQSPVVRRWIAAGELTVEGLGAGTASPAPTQSLPTPSAAQPSTSGAYDPYRSTSTMSEPSRSGKHSPKPRE